jgi:hypothetical protein
MYFHENSFPFRVKYGCVQPEGVFLLKIVLSNFCPKQDYKWIVDPRALFFELFIAFLT